ncbi:hypothetical protein BLNAU_15930 [Blattamonas nauphoetae]|uniref:Uncharacterized protein n=1 Tax=Blattamonas nauphoetae TaxID=2049346 RepID=A0ABQ9XDZ6_9EUKA|nr:hypothetical protein BLNAU_15930 [Blattamonas nauphoetae]
MVVRHPKFNHFFAEALEQRVVLNPKQNPQVRECQWNRRGGGGGMLPPSIGGGGGTFPPESGGGGGTLPPPASPGAETEFIGGGGGIAPQSHGVILL